MGHDGVSDGVESSVDHFTTAAPGQVTSAFPPSEQRQSAGAGMDYEGFFKDRLEALHAEGRYRIFADLERRRGRFPRAYEDRIGAEVTASTADPVDFTVDCAMNSSSV
jgi:hypothetical protein